MLHKSLIKELEKSGFTIEVDLTNYKSVERYVCKNSKNIMSWYAEKHHVDAIHVKRIDQEDDIHTDYFPRTFFHSIKSAINNFRI